MGLAGSCSSSRREVMRAFEMTGPDIGEAKGQGPAGCEVIRVPGRSKCAEILKCSRRDASAALSALGAELGEAGGNTGGQRCPGRTPTRTGRRAAKAQPSRGRGVDQVSFQGGE